MDAIRSFKRGLDLNVTSLARRSMCFGCGSQRSQDDPEQSLGFFQYGKLLVLLDRGDYWQCGFVIPKGGFDEIKARGLPHFRRTLSSLRRISARPRNRAGRLVENQIADRADQSSARLVPRRIALHRRFCARHVASRRRRDQSRDSGCGRDRELAGGKIAKRTGFGGRSAKSAGAPRMADAPDSGNAGFYSSTGCYWQTSVTNSRCRM